MEGWNFVKVEQEIGGRVRVHVVHPTKPRLVVEFLPRYHADGRMVGGELKRICAENSPNGQYHTFGPVVRQAEKFFLASLAQPTGSAAATRQNPPPIPPAIT